MSANLTTRIIGTGKYKADGVLTNFDLEKMVDTSDEWITERTGISERRVASKDVMTSDMAAVAVQSALEMAGKKANDLDMIICGTVTGDMPLPATAAVVQKKSGHPTYARRLTFQQPVRDLFTVCQWQTRL